MIVDLEGFVTREQPIWDELAKFLDSIEAGDAELDNLDRIQRFRYLFQRTSSDLAKVKGSAAEPELERYLEALVGRGYAEMHETRHRGNRLNVVQWFMETFPQTFRRQAWAFRFALIITIVGGLLGAFLTHVDPDSRVVILPFSHLHGDPSERVAEEEEAKEYDRLAGNKSRFSAELMANNIGVTIKAMAFGIFWGLGTVLILFYNGVILGAVVFDYVVAGETVFLLGWLLPHGATELPAIFIGGQAGLVVGRALIGWGTNDGVRTRFRKIAPDIVTLIAGAAVLLVWAGLVEAFFSQYHEPVLPYGVKIAFGLIEIGVLVFYLNVVGRRKGGE